jgi:prenylcysteine oxidase/farnesylcysteine lyase
MAGAGASSVVGGNRRIFANFAKHSDASIHLNTRVVSIEKLVDIQSAVTQQDRQPGWLVRYEDVRGGQMSTRAYDAMIYAAPIHPPTPATAAPTKFINTDIPDLVPELAYVKLHVTIVVTNATNPKSAFFGVKEKAPATILATFEPFIAGTSKIRPRINSLNYLRKLGKVDAAEGESHVVKSGSPSALFVVSTLTNCSSLLGKQAYP